MQHSFFTVDGTEVVFNSKTGEFEKGELLEVLEALHELHLSGNPDIEVTDCGDQIVGSLKVGSKYIVFDYCKEENGVNSYDVFNEGYKARDAKFATVQYYSDNQN